MVDVLVLTAVTVGMLAGVMVGVDVSALVVAAVGVGVPRPSHIDSRSAGSVSHRVSARAWRGGESR